MYQKNIQNSHTDKNVKMSKSEIFIIIIRILIILTRIMADSTRKFLFIFN